MDAAGKLLYKSVELGEESFMEERFDRLEREIEIIKAKRNPPASFDSSPLPLLPPLRLSQLPSFLLVLLQLQL